MAKNFKGGPEAIIALRQLADEAGIGLKGVTDFISNLAPEMRNPQDMAMSLDFGLGGILPMDATLPHLEALHRFANWKPSDSLSNYPIGKHSSWGDSSWRTNYATDTFGFGRYTGKVREDPNDPHFKEVRDRYSTLLKNYSEALANKRKQTNVSDEQFREDNSYNISNMHNLNAELAGLSYRRELAKIIQTLGDKDKALALVRMMTNG